MPKKIGKVGKRKTSSAAKKRIKTTGTGKMGTNKVARRHLLLQKSKRQKALANKTQLLPKSETKKLATLLGR